MKNKTLVALVALVVATGCASGTLPSPDAHPDEAVPHAERPADPRVPATDGSPLPSDDFNILAALYDPLLATRGLRLESAYLSTPDGYYGDSDDYHLAIYAQATRALSPDDYVTNVTWAASDLTADVFTRWPGLDSFDLCQQPQPTTDEPAPGQVTRIDITRSGAEQHHLSEIALRDLLEIADDPESGVTVTIDAPADTSDLYRDARPPARP